MVPGGPVLGYQGGLLGGLGVPLSSCKGSGLVSPLGDHLEKISFSSV